MNAGTTAPVAPAASSTTLVSAASVSASSPATTICSRFRRLSPEEMADKCKKGECHFYPEKFSLDHKCASKGVFLMELEETDDPEAVAGELGVSLLCIILFVHTPES
jgi:hypothetical protein